MMRTLTIYSQQLSYISYHGINCSHHVVYYIPSTYLSYNWKFDLWTTFFQFLHQPPTSGNHKSDLFFYEFGGGVFFFNLINELICLFIYFWLCWVFVAMCRLSLVVASGGYSLLRCVGFSLRWLLLLWSMGSRCAGFTSCGARAQ